MSAEFEIVEELPPHSPRPRDDIRAFCKANPGEWVRYPGVANHKRWKDEGFRVSRRGGDWHLMWPEEQT